MRSGATRLSKSVLRRGIGKGPRGSRGLAGSPPPAFFASVFFPSPPFLGLGSPLAFLSAFSALSSALISIDLLHVGGVDGSFLLHDPSLLVATRLGVTLDQ